MSTLYALPCHRLARSSAPVRLPAVDRPGSARMAPPVARPPSRGLPAVGAWRACLGVEATCQWRAPTGGVLQVNHGKAWLTRDGSLSQPATDVVLAEGAELRVLPGQRWLIQALHGSLAIDWLPLE